MENGLIAKIAKEKSINLEQDYISKKKKMQTEIKNEVLKIYCKDDKNRLSDAFLSEYSTNSDAEWFAETFTNMELSDKPAPIAQALKEYLGRYE